MLYLAFSRWENVFPQRPTPPRVSESKTEASIQAVHGAISRGVRREMPGDADAMGLWVLGLQVPLPEPGLAVLPARRREMVRDGVQDADGVL